MIIEKQDTYFRRKQIEIDIKVLQQKIKNLEQKKLYIQETIKDKKSQLISL
jgi:hypothetical protein